MGVLISDPYLYYNSIEDTPVWCHLDFNCLKVKYEVNHDIPLLILAPGYTESTWGCVILTVYERHRCQTIARYTGKFSPWLKVKLVITLVLLNPELTLVLLIPFLKTLDPDLQVSFRGHLIRIYTVFHTNWKYRFKLNKIKFGRSVTVAYIKYSAWYRLKILFIVKNSFSLRFIFGCFNMFKCIQRFYADTVASYSKFTFSLI